MKIPQELATILSNFWKITIAKLNVPMRLAKSVVFNDADEILVERKSLNSFY